MSAPSVAELLHLVDRAERGTLLAGEAVQLRAGIRALGAGAVTPEEPRPAVPEEAS